MQDKNINNNFEILNKNEKKKQLEEENKKVKNFRCEKCYRILLSSIEFKKNIRIFNSCSFCDKSEYINSLENFLKKSFSLESSMCRKCGKIYGNNKNNINENFYYCHHCSLILCHNCKRINKEHNIISKIQQYDSICQKHYYSYTNFCDDCNISLCPDCVSDHKKEHNIKSLSALFIEKDQLKIYEKIISDERTLLNVITEVTFDIVNKLNNMINEIKDIYNIYKKNLQNIIDIHNTILTFYTFAAINQDMCYEQMKSFQNFFNVSNDLKELIKRVKCNNDGLLDKYNKLINYLKDNNNYIIKSSDDLKKRKINFKLIITRQENINESNNKKQIEMSIDEKSTGLSSEI